MCGIVGVVNWGDAETLSRMTQLQRHRGPDDGGVESIRASNGGWIGLGSRRLSILDLSPAGHMPMWNDDRTLCIAYNGEVYNFPELKEELIRKGHHFRSHCDTEVILRLYEEEGPDCVRRLNGMFAFALWDARRRQLFVARDPFGIKPIYYIHQGERFACASEIKSLLQLPGVERSLDMEALGQFLTFLWVPDPKTMLAGVAKLPAGHYAIFRDGSLRVERYWNLEFPPDGASYPTSENELIEEVRERFRRAVHSQMVSDVPIGAFLSAGLDSTSIVAMMSEATRERVRTYTITFPEKYRVGEITLDDPAVARRVAERFGCDHHEIVVEPEVAGLLPKLIWHMDEPVADPAIITAYSVCRDARQSATVLLSGIGGDELFAGYRKHAAHYWAEAYRRMPRMIRRGLIEPLIGSLPSFRGTRWKGLTRLAKKMAKSGALDPRDRFLMNCTYLDELQKGLLLTPDAHRHLSGCDPAVRHRAHFDEVRGADFLNQMLYLDTKVFMVSLNLTYNDKMSMASSVEVRVPFLDRELAEFVAARVPPRLKLRGFWQPTTKYIFRRAMRGILPDEVLTQPKAGFGAPVDYWLAHDLREMVDDLLSERRVRDRGLFNPGVVRLWIDEQRCGRRDWSMQIWQLLTLELWMQTFLDSDGSHAIGESPAMPACAGVSN